MSLIATSKQQTEFQQPPEGTHVARAVGVIDLGTQVGEYAGERTVRHQIVIRWELPHETLDVDGKPMPMLCSRFYTLSSHEKSTLRKDVEAWMGRRFNGEEVLNGFDCRRLLGKACQVTIQHNDAGKAKVIAVSALAKGMQCPPQVNQNSYYEIEQGRDAAFDALPKGFQRIIEECQEWNGGTTRPTPSGTKTKPSVRDINGALQMAAQDDLDSDIPF